MKYTEREDLPAHMINEKDAAKYASLANRLDELQAAENEGDGIPVVQSIIRLLRAGKIEQARNHWKIDGDKLHTYPDIECLITEEMSKID